MGFNLIQKVIDIIRHKKFEYYEPYFKKFLNYDLGVNGYYISCGDKNPDKVFFVMYRPPLGAGLLSNIRWIIRYLAVIEGTDLIPVIDDVNFKSFYTEKEKINDSYSWWNYYFEPVSKYSLEEVYSSKHVIICDGEYVGQTGKPYTEDPDVLALEEKMYEKYFKFNDFFKADLEQDTRFNQATEFLKTPTLGIHFRGSDMAYWKNHLTPATLNQVLKYANKYIKENNYSQIYLATECEDYKNAIVNYYKEKNIKVMCNNQSFGGIEKLTNIPKTLDNTVFRGRGGGGHTPPARICCLI